MIKVILIKVFVKRGAGKRNFIHKGFFPAKQFCNSPFCLSSYNLKNFTEVLEEVHAAFCIGFSLSVESFGIFRAGLEK